MNYFRQFLFCSVIAVLSACMSPSFAAEPDVAERGMAVVLDPTGVWTFALKSNVGKSFSRTFSDELLVGGTIYVTPPADTFATYTYTISGDTITIVYEVKDGAAVVNHRATYTGTLTASSMTGTYVVLDGGALDSQDTGTWSAKRTPSTFSAADATSVSAKYLAAGPTGKLTSAYKIAATIMLPSTFDLTTLNGASSFQLQFASLTIPVTLNLDAKYVAGATKATLVEPATGTKYVLDWSKKTTLKVTVSGKGSQIADPSKPAVPPTGLILISGIGLGAVPVLGSPGLVSIPAQFTFGTYSKTIAANVTAKYKASFDTVTGGTFSIASKVLFPKTSKN